MWACYYSSCVCVLVRCVSVCALSLLQGASCQQASHSTLAQRLLLTSEGGGGPLLPLGPSSLSQFQLRAQWGRPPLVAGARENPVRSRAGTVPLSHAFLLPLTPRWQGERWMAHTHPSPPTPALPECGTLRGSFREGQQIYEPNTDSPITSLGNPSFWSRGRNEIIVK